MNEARVSHQVGTNGIGCGPQIPHGVPLDKWLGEVKELTSHSELPDWMRDGNGLAELGPSYVSLSFLIEESIEVVVKTRYIAARHEQKGILWSADVNV